MGAQAQTQARLCDGSQVGRGQVFLPQVHTVGPFFDGDLPVVVDEQLGIGGACRLDAGAYLVTQGGVVGVFQPELHSANTRREDTV